MRPRFHGDAAAASAAALDLPHGLTIDAAGNLYLADTANHRIRRIDAITGIITTIAGQGTQTFAGDNGPAASASLDTPRESATTTSTGLITLADTGNQRIRQISPTPTRKIEIHTIAGLGITTPGALTLTAPAVIAYGTGRLSATLYIFHPSHRINHLLRHPLQLHAPTTIGTTSLTANSATLDTGTLPAGTHIIAATYAGDQTHASARKFLRLPHHHPSATGRIRLPPRRYFTASPFQLSLQPSPGSSHKTQATSPSPSPPTQPTSPRPEHILSPRPLPARQQGTTFPRSTPPDSDH